MKALAKHTLETLDDFSTGQLKAFYVGHADQYIQKLTQSLELLSAEAALYTFPEWVPASCALVAAGSCLFKVCKKISGFFTKEK